MDDREWDNLSGVLKVEAGKIGMPDAADAPLTFRNDSRPRERSGMAAPSPTLEPRLSEMSNAAQPSDWLARRPSPHSRPSDDSLSPIQSVEMSDMRRRCAGAENLAELRGTECRGMALQVEALRSQLGLERKLRSNAENALTWMTEQVHSAGVTTQGTLHAQHSPGSVDLSDVAGFARPLVTAEEAQTVVNLVKERSEEDAESQLQELREQLSEHQAASSIQAKWGVRRSRQALVALGRRMAVAERRAGVATAGEDKAAWATAEAELARAVAEQDMAEAKRDAEQRERQAAEAGVALRLAEKMARKAQAARTALEAREKEVLELAKVQAAEDAIAATRQIELRIKLFCCDVRSITYSSVDVCLTAVAWGDRRALFLQRQCD